MTLRAATGIPFLPLTEGGEIAMPQSLIALCKKIDLPGPVLYLEAEYFGGVGTQAYAVINGGELVSGPIAGVDAINSALALVGVNVSEDEDRFRVVGLNKYRDTDQWFQEFRRLQSARNRQSALAEIRHISITTN